MENTHDFESWAMSFAGCDGGDIGSPSKPATWVCGIEWGGAHTPDQLSGLVNNPRRTPLEGYADWQHNLSFRFNWQVMKILSAINGGLVSDYKNYAEKIRPFTRGSFGFFKLNLFPMGFRHTSEKHWKQFHASISGFDSKKDYLSWCRDHRIPMIESWSEKYRPKLVICLGKTFIEDFSAAFAAPVETYNHEVIDQKDIRWQINPNGTLVVILPFMIGRHGLIRNLSIQKVGERIGSLLEKS